MPKFKITQKITAVVEAPDAKKAELFFNFGTSHWNSWDIAADADDPIVEEKREE